MRGRKWRKLLLRSFSLTAAQLMHFWRKSHADPVKPCHHIGLPMSIERGDLKNFETLDLA